jgi:hypothetical protein
VPIGFPSAPDHARKPTRRTRGGGGGASRDGECHSATPLIRSRPLPCCGSRGGGHQQGGSSCTVWSRGPLLLRPPSPRL